MCLCEFGLFSLDDSSCCCCRWLQTAFCATRLHILILFGPHHPFKPRDGVVSPTLKMGRERDSIGGAARAYP